MLLTFDVYATISDPSFLYLNDGSCIDYVCTSQDDPMWQLTKAKDGILKGTKEEADLYNQYDDDYCNYLKETKRYKSGTAFVDPSKCAVWWWWCFIFVWLILLRVWALVICCFVAMVVDSFPPPLLFVSFFFSSGNVDQHRLPIHDLHSIHPSHR